MKEVWKDIKGYENYYKVSNKGRVKSLSRIVTRTNGRKLPIKGKILRPIISVGYEHVILGDVRKKQKTKQFKIHRLVAMAFIDNPKNKPNINHKDFNRRNNNVSNLEWCTQKENMVHWYNANGIDPKGELNGRSVLTNDDVIFIRKNHKNYTGKELMKMFKIKETALYDVIAKRSWKHI